MLMKGKNEVKGTVLLTSVKYGSLERFVFQSGEFLKRENRKLIVLEIRLLMSF